MPKKVLLTVTVTLLFIFTATSVCAAGPLDSSVNFQDLVRFLSDKTGLIPCYEITVSEIDITPPAANIEINNGDGVTYSPNVSLTISARDDITPTEKLKMRFSNDKQNWTAWEQYRTSKDWVLSENLGAKTVYLQVKDLADNVGSTLDTITLEQNKNNDEDNNSDNKDNNDDNNNNSNDDDNNNDSNGSGTFWSTSGVEGIARIDGEEVTARYIKSKLVTLKVSASNVKWVQYSFDGTNWSDKRNITSGEITERVTLPVTEGDIRVYAKFSSGDEHYVQFVYDTKRPIVSARTMSGATATSGSSIRLFIDAEDDVTPRDLLEYSINGSEWNRLSETGIVNAPISRGLNSLQITVKDQAGNQASTIVNAWGL